MAEIWGAAIVAVGAYAASNNASNKAAKAQKNASNAAISASQQNYDKTASNLNPFIDAGKNAVGTMQALNSGDFSSFKVSPDYQFAMTQGLQGLDRSAAARGSLYSGGHSADVMNYAQGLATQNYNNYYARLQGLADSGQNAASNLGSVGTGNAASIGNASQNAANGATSAAYNNANAQTNLLGQFASLYGQWNGQKDPTTTSYSLGGNGAQPYQNINNGELQNGTFDFTKASGGV